VGPADSSDDTTVPAEMDAAAVEVDAEAVDAAEADAGAGEADATEGDADILADGADDTGDGNGDAAEGLDASAGIGTPDVCTFQVDGTLSSAIPTVGVVEWSTDIAGLTAAKIEFTLNDPMPNELNRGGGGSIDVTGTTHRALLLGLKGARTYTYRIVATAGSTDCTSADQTLTTGAATGAPLVTRVANDPDAQAPGFIVTSGGYPEQGISPEMAYIIDADGDIVWWTASSARCSRALMDWEGAAMWMVDSNPVPIGTGDVRRVGMDGIDVLDIVDGGLSYAHHDIAVLPGGIVAALVWADADAGSSDLVERAPDGTLTTVVRLDGKIFPVTRSGEAFHANSIQYHPTDDTYTIGDEYAAAYVKLTRQGQPLWQFGQDCTGAPAPQCATGEQGGNHGHHLLDDGRFLFFNAGIGSSSYEYQLTESMTSLTASQLWTYMDQTLSSIVLGDIQALPNGNRLIDYATDGVMIELSPSGDLVQTLTALEPPTSPPNRSGSFGYANFRESLYGPPLR